MGSSVVRLGVPTGPEPVTAAHSLYRYPVRARSKIGRWNIDRIDARADVQCPQCYVSLADDNATWYGGVVIVE